MNRRTPAALLISVALIATGCVSVPQGQTLEQAGPAPTPEQAEAAVLKHLRRSLLDPDSLKDFKVVSGPHLINGMTAGRNYEQAWLLCAEFNAKNAYGGYTGLKVQGYPMRFGSDGNLFMVSTVNWISTDRKC